MEKVECKQCGKCCKFMIVAPSIPYDDHKEWLEFHGITLVESFNTPWPALRFEIPCKHLDENGKCKIYNERPKSCKVFPVGKVKECPEYGKRQKIEEEIKKLQKLL